MSSNASPRPARPTRDLFRVGLALAMVALGACSATPSTPPARAPEDYALVLLRSGPERDAKSPEEMRVLMQGHFANMQRLAGERLLLLAGPFGEPRRDPTLRGLFVFDVRTVEEGRMLTASDPSVVGGVLRADARLLSTGADLRGLLERELERQESVRASGREPAIGENVRGYVLLVAEDLAAAERELDELGATGRVLLRGTLDGTSCLAVLDAVDLATAEALLGARRERLGPHTLDPWWATDGLAGP